MKELILFLMIFLDWSSHIVQHLNRDLKLFRLWESLINYVGYSNFWIGYWGFALLLAFFILIDRRRR